MDRTPGIEVPSGSLGQGISAAVGMALAARYLGKDTRIFVLIGDGESQEGQVWEAAMAAGNYHLDNLIAILDYNGLQGDGPVREIMNLEPLAGKWQAFGWNVHEINGNDMSQVVMAIQSAIDNKGQGKPFMIIAHTVKGEGVSFMENVQSWHGSRPPNAEQLAQALAELRSKEATF